MDLLIFIVGVAMVGLGLILAVNAFRRSGRAEPRLTTNAEWREQQRSPSSRSRQINPRSGSRPAAFLLLLLGGLLIFLDSSTTVGARSVAVQTAFGKIQGAPFKAGWHWVAPWNSVEKFDASVQTLKFYQDEKEDDGGCITVRLANNTLACVDVTAQWNINHNGDINNLYLQYRTFDNIHDNLVKRQLGSALNEVFGSYDPLAAVNSGPGTSTVNTKQLQDQVQAALVRDLRGFIGIPSVTIPVVHFDGDTEARLKAYQQSIADTRIAEQQKQTATQQALAAKELAAQPGLQDAGVQYQNCLNLTKDLAQRDQLKNLPMTWNCGGDSPNLLLSGK